MSETGKIRVVVRSRKVPSGTFVLDRPVYTTNGARFGSEPRRIIIYRTTYESHDLEAIERGRLLASELGLKFEIVDLSRENPLKRLAMTFLGDGSPVTILPAPAEPAKAEPAQPLFEQSVNAN